MKSSESENQNINFNVNNNNEIWDDLNTFELSKKIETSSFIKKFLSQYINTTNVIFVITKGSPQVDVNFSLFWEFKLEEVHVHVQDHEAETEAENEATEVNLTANTQLPEQTRVNTLTETHYISLSGSLIKYKEESFVLEGRVLDDSSSKNLLEVLQSDSDTDNLNTKESSEDHYHLIDSLCRQARAHILETSRQENPLSRLQVYFQNSVVIDKREYPLFILETFCDSAVALNNNSNFVLSDDIKGQLESSELSVEEKENLVKSSFYLVHPEVPFETLEQTIFSSHLIYEKLLDDLDEEIGMKIEKLSKSSIKLSDLQGEKVANDEDKETNTNTNLSSSSISSNLDLENEYKNTDNTYLDLDLLLIEPIFLTQIPHLKCTHLLRLYTHLCEGMLKSGNGGSADYLLPLITFSVIKMKRGAELKRQIKFIERFLHPAASTGIIQYILTNFTAAFEIILELYAERFLDEKNEIYKLAALKEKEKEKERPESLDEKDNETQSENIIINVNTTAKDAPLTNPLPLLQSPQSPVTTTTTGHFVNMITSIGQVPKAIGAAVVSGFKRSDVVIKSESDIILDSDGTKSGIKSEGQSLRSLSIESYYNSPATAVNLLTSSPELARFRERILATNSANDLNIRDLNPLLEDYKNLLFILFKL